MPDMDFKMPPTRRCHLVGLAPKAPGVGDDGVILLLTGIDTPRALNDL